MLDLGQISLRRGGRTSCPNDMANASFVTGATGFIGKRLVARLLERGEGPVYFLVHPRSVGKLDALYARWGVDRTKAIAVPGDLTAPGLGIRPEDAALLKGRVRHVFHLAAVYDLAASAQAQQRANVEGTRHAVGFAAALGARCFHHMSSIAAAGHSQVSALPRPSGPRSGSTGTTYSWSPWTNAVVHEPWTCQSRTLTPPPPARPA